MCASIAEEIPLVGETRKEGLIFWIHKKLQRWAIWTLSPVGAIFPGTSGTIEQKIREGRGTILPGAPRGSGAPRVLVDHEAARIEMLIAKMPKRRQRVIRAFYLRRGSVEQSAKSLGLSEKALYRKIALCHKHLERLLVEG